MTKAIFGIIKNQQQAEQVVEQLKNEGFSANEITVLYHQNLKSQQKPEQKGSKNQPNANENMNAKQTTGWTKAIGSLPNTSTVTLGQNTFLVAGPLSGLLKNAGNNINAITATLTKNGVSENDATRLIEKLKDQNNILVGIFTNTNNVDKAKKVFEKNSANPIISTAEFAGAGKKGAPSSHSEQQW